MRNKPFLASIAIAAVLLALFVLLNVPAISDDTAKEKGKPMASATKSTFLVTSPHTQEECMAAIDATAEKGAEHLNQWSWGCMAGDHTGYAFVTAADEKAALANVPENVRAKAKATKVDKFTLEQIKQFHEQAHSGQSQGEKY
jgi:hypothetical protein